jgi:hypothetical protein
MTWANAAASSVAILKHPLAAVIRLARGELPEGQMVPVPQNEGGPHPGEDVWRRGAFLRCLTATLSSIQIRGGRRKQPAGPLLFEPDP